ncbi:MAG: hypothetical protein RMY34_15915 [Aulosira sp. DedQUE10]|nr:hypothetical protein [Aulosira sp. DedQUE10]
MPKIYEPELPAERFYKKALEQFNCSKSEARIDSLQQAIAIQQNYLEA